MLHFSPENEKQKSCTIIIFWFSSIFFQSHLVACYDLILLHSIDLLEKLMSYNYHHIISNYYYDYFFSLRNKFHPQTLQIKVMQDPGKRNNIPFSIKEVKVRKSCCSTKFMNSETKFFFPMRQ